MKLLIRDSKGISNPINIMESDSVHELKEQIKQKALSESIDNEEAIDIDDLSWMTPLEENKE